LQYLKWQKKVTFNLNGDIASIELEANEIMKTIANGAVKKFGVEEEFIVY
jgi:hypothetical protein